MEGQYWVCTCDGIQKESKMALNDFLLNLKISNKSEATITKYKWILEGFLKDFHKPINTFTTEDVHSWIKIFSIDKKDRTIDLYLSCLNSFFNFCLEEDWMDQVLMKKRWRPKLNEALPKYLTEAEYAKVMIAAESFTIRNRALILFLFSSGCRRGEICNLLIKDVDLTERKATVTGKGNKIRIIHFSIECSIVLQKYLKTRKYEDDDPLFLNKFGNPLGPSGVFKIIKQLGESAGLSQTLHPHVCRHTFATSMLARGADLSFIAEEMGHSDLDTTRVYARIPKEEMMSVYQNKMG